MEYIGISRPPEKEHMGQPEIAALTEQLQNGDASGVGPYMSGLFTEDRLNTLQLIREQNQKNREADPSVPALQIRARTGAHDGRTYEEIDLMPGGLSNLMGGKPLYSGCVDIKNLSRCDTNGSGSVQALPESRHQVDIRALTSKLEQGNGRGVGALLSPLALEERVRVFNAVKAANQEDLAAGRTHARLDIDIDTPKGGYDKISVVRVMPGAHDFWMGGTMLYSDSLNVNNRERKTWEGVDPEK